MGKDEAADEEPAGRDPPHARRGGIDAAFGVLRRIRDLLLRGEGERQIDAFDESAVLLRHPPQHRQAVLVPAEIHEVRAEIGIRRGGGGVAAPLLGPLREPILEADAADRRPARLVASGLVAGAEHEDLRGARRRPVGLPFPVVRVAVGGKMVGGVEQTPRPEADGGVWIGHDPAQIVGAALQPLDGEFAFRHRLARLAALRRLVERVELRLGLRRLGRLRLDLSFHVGQVVLGLLALGLGHAHQIDPDGVVEAGRQIELGAEILLAVGQGLPQGRFGRRLLPRGHGLGMRPPVLAQGVLGAGVGRPLRGAEPAREIVQIGEFPDKPILEGAHRLRHGIPLAFQAAPTIRIWISSHGRQAR